MITDTAAATPVSFGPRASGAAVTTVATTPYLRPRGQVASQTTYTAAAVAEFGQGNRTVAVAASAAYFGSAPATWTLDVPDLSAAGYDPAWALASGQATGWRVYAAGGDVLPFFGGNPLDNARMIIAGAQDNAIAGALPPWQPSLRRLRHRR